MNKRRLTCLANFLDTKVTDDWFDLDIIASAGFPEKECGSVACAMGWIPSAFPRRSDVTLEPVSDLAMASRCNIIKIFQFKLMANRYMLLHQTSTTTNVTAVIHYSSSIPCSFNHSLSVSLS